MPPPSANAAAARHAAARDEEHEHTARRVAEERRRAEAGGGRAGWVGIGKLANGGTAATTPTPAGGVEVVADRRSWLGNRFEMPPRPHSAGQDERYRAPVVRATEILLAELEARGTSDARRIATEGPGGHGWRVGGRQVALPISRGLALADPHGRRLWREVEWLGEQVDAGVGVRLLCHCRWQRGGGHSGGRECHCQPVAEHVERAARRAMARRLDHMVATVREAAAGAEGATEAGEATGGGTSGEPQAATAPKRRRVWFMEVDEQREYAVSREERDDKRRACEEVRAGRRRNEQDAAMEAATARRERQETEGARARHERREEEAAEVAIFLSELAAEEELASVRARVLEEVALPTRAAAVWIREAMAELAREEGAAEDEEAHEARVPAKRSRGDKGRQHRSGDERKRARKQADRPGQG
jgi:hypothetical protein